MKQTIAKQNMRLKYKFVYLKSLHCWKLDHFLLESIFKL